MAARRTPHMLAALALVGPILLVSALFVFSAQGAGNSELKGRYVLRHSDDFAAGKARFQPMLELADGTLLELNYGLSHAPNVNPGSKVTIKGSRKGNAVLVADGGTQVTAGPSPTVAAGTTKRVAVVLFTFSNATTQPYATSTADGVAFTNSNSVAAYYLANSWNGVTLTGDVFGWYAIPDANTSCNYTAWATSAKAAATAAGVNLSAYDHVVYGFPSTSSCGWSGLAYMPGRESWLNGSGGMSLRTMAHELGHNLGTHHASAMSCTEGGVRVPLATNQSSCTSSEYGDPFSVMGSSTRRHTNFSLGNMGWLDTSVVQTVTSAGDYTLKPLLTSGVQYLRVQRTSSSYLTLEFRQPSPTFDTFSPTDPVVNGVTVRLTGNTTTRSQSQLVDTTPSTTGFTDAPLGVGKTLVDPLAGISITTVSVSASGAVVHVAWGGSPPPNDTTPPSQPGSLLASPLDPNRVALTWAASTDNVGVVGYRVLRNSNLVTTVTGTGYTDTGLSPATSYAYQVVAIDAAGNGSTPAGASATTPADTQPPTSPSPLSATASDSTTALLSWPTASDNVAVASYRVFRDGVQLTTTASRSYSDGGRVAGATYQYAVAAVDSSGNVGPQASASLTMPSTPPPPVDTEAPTSPQNLTFAAGRGKKMLLTWDACTDNVGVAGYRVYRDGKLLATVLTPNYTDTLGGKNASATYSVVAYDAAGNTSTPAVATYAAAAAPAG